MNELECLGKLRKPLEPLPPKDGAEDVAYKARVAKYKELLDEFYALQDLKGKASASSREPEAIQSKEECLRRIPRYIEARETYVKANTGHLETIKMVCANIERLHEAMDALDDDDWGELPRSPLMPSRSDFDSDEAYEAAKAKYEEDEKRFFERDEKFSSHTARWFSEYARLLLESVYETNKYEEIAEAIKN